MAGKTACLVLLCLPVMLQGQYPEQYALQPPFEDQYGQSPIPPTDYNPDFDYTETQFETEPTEPGPLDCREEQYPCTRLYSVHRPCKQCLKSLCFYSLRRVYVVNKEVCIRTICAHEELLRADLCRDKYSKCGVMANSGLCGQMASSCVRSCGSC